MGFGCDRKATSKPKLLLIQIKRHLDRIVGVQKQVLAADAAVDAAERHEEAEGEEVAVVEVAHAVVQPGWTRVEFNTVDKWNIRRHTTLGK